MKNKKVDFYLYTKNYDDIFLTRKLKVNEKKFEDFKEWMLDKYDLMFDDIEYFQFYERRTKYYYSNQFIIGHLLEYLDISISFIIKEFLKNE